MVSNERPPDARPVFRKLALGVAIFCFLLAAISGWVAGGDATMAIIFLAVGAMMAVIGVTGYWPPRR